MDNPDPDTGKKRSYYGRIFFVLLLFNLCFALWCLFFYFPGNYQDSAWPLIGKVFVLLFVEIIFIPVGMYLFLKMLPNREVTDATFITRDQSQDMLSHSTGMCRKTPIRSRLRQSGEYAWKGYVSQWAVLAVFTVIFPLGLGYLMQVMKGINPAPKAEWSYSLFIDGMKMFIFGILFIIIWYLFANILVIIPLFPVLLMVFTTSFTGINFFFPSLVGAIIVSYIICIIGLALAATLGVVRLARTGNIGVAFGYRNIWAIIQRIGVIKVIGSQAVLGIIILTSLLLPLIIAMALRSEIKNLVIALCLTLLLFCVICPFTGIMAARFVSLLYDEGMDTGSNTTEPDLPITDHLATEGE